LWATADSISANLFKSNSDGGSLINSYELFRNNGGTSTDAIKVTTYNGVSSSHTLTVANDGIVAGLIYKLKYRATNVYGYSDFSEELNIGVTSFPAKPDPVTVL
jgi:hypothetical protein